MSFTINELIFLAVAVFLMCVGALLYLLVSIAPPGAISYGMGGDINNARPHSVVEYVAHRDNGDVLISFRSDRNTVYHCDSDRNNLDVCQLVQPGDQISFRTSEQYDELVITELTIE